MTRYLNLLLPLALSSVAETVMSLRACLKDLDSASNTATEFLQWYVREYVRSMYVNYGGEMMDEHNILMCVGITSTLEVEERKL